jgi:bifunctional UDP-N-acetylglucosamine pyrophosphorylase / glucosamine-1-phosphate N-acetyltransferase
VGYNSMAIVMAAGKGTRMKSDLPKVLVPVRQRPMIAYVLDTLDRAGIEQIVVVVGYRAADVRAALADRPRIQFALQSEQLGTGHAVMMCREQLAQHEGPVLVVAGDSPLMQADSILALLQDFERRPAACLLGTGYKENPAGLGRVIRDGQGGFERIVEEKDATAEQKRIREVNLSCYLFQARDLLWAIEQIKADNVQREYYLTDCPGVLQRAGKEVRALDVLNPCEALSINTIEDLQAVELAMQSLGDH